MNTSSLGKIIISNNNNNNNNPNVDILGVSSEGVSIKKDVTGIFDEIKRHIDRLPCKEEQIGLLIDTLTRIPHEIAGNIALPLSTSNVLDGATVICRTLLNIQILVGLDYDVYRHLVDLVGTTSPSPHHTTTTITTTTTTTTRKMTQPPPSSSSPSLLPPPPLDHPRSDTYASRRPQQEISRLNSELVKSNKRLMEMMRTNTQNELLLEQSTEKYKKLHLSTTTDKVKSYTVIADLRLANDRLKQESVSHQKKHSEISEKVSRLEMTVDELKKENTDMKQCKICYDDNVKLAVCVPCGHIFCVKCIDSLKKRCGLCRVEITQSIVLYYS